MKKKMCHAEPQWLHNLNKGLGLIKTNFTNISNISDFCLWTVKKFPQNDKSRSIS